MQALNRIIEKIRNYVNAQNNWGDTALIIECRSTSNKNKGILKLLSKKNIDVNIQNRSIKKIRQTTL